MQDRVHKLDGVLNFRDFGGYDTEDGGKVRPGTLFRSAHFAEATEADIARINALGIRIVCDLRRPEERKQQVCRWPDITSIARVLTSEDGGLDKAPHLAFLQEGDLSPAAVSGFMRDIYSRIPYDKRYVALFRAYFEELASGEGGALVHCAAGKDRTGILCALTLIALDVPEPTVREDYILTNQAVDFDRRMERVRENFAAQLGKLIPDESIRPILGVDHSYLSTAFDSMSAKHGDVRGYMRERLGIDDAMRGKLKARFVS